MRQGRGGSLRCYVIKPRFHPLAAGHELSQLKAKELGCFPHSLSATGWVRAASRCMKSPQAENCRVAFGA